MKTNDKEKTLKVIRGKISHHIQGNITKKLQTLVK